MPRFSFKEEASQRSFRQTRNDQDDGVGDDQSLLSGGGASVASSSSSILVAFMNETFESLEDEVCQELIASGAAHQEARSVINAHNAPAHDMDSVCTQTTIQSVALEAVVATTDFVLSHWKILAFGQFISLMMASAGAAQATLHFDCNLSAPLFCSGIFFVLLSLHLIPVYARRDEINTRVVHNAEESVDPNRRPVPSEAYIWFLCIFPVKTDPWRYALIAFLDVQACYCTILAFKYTPMTSVALFAALAVPSAMILSRICLGRSFGYVHLTGVCMCMMGVIYNVLADYNIELSSPGLTDEEFPFRLFGDFLAIMGGILYGVVDVVAEFVLKTDEGDTTEFLGMIGFFATLISFFQGWLTERNDVVELYTGGECSLAKTGALLLIYVITSALEYIGIAHFLSKSEATLLNLSILTDPALWSVLFTVVAQNIHPPPLFWAALVFVVGGLGVYEIAPSPIQKRKNSAAMLKDDFDNQSDDYYSPEVNTI